MQQQDDKEDVVSINIQSAFRTLLPCLITLVLTMDNDPNAGLPRGMLGDFLAGYKWFVRHV